MGVLFSMLFSGQKAEPANVRVVRGEKREPGESGFQGKLGLPGQVGYKGKNIKYLKI